MSDFRTEKLCGGCTFGKKGVSDCVDSGCEMAMRDEIKRLRERLKIAQDSEKFGRIKYDELKQQVSTDKGD